MSSLSSMYIKASTLKTLLETVEKKQENGIEITISISEETNDYGQNLSAFVSQSKEQREAGTKRYYVGNGKCFWTDGKIQAAAKQDNQNKSSASVQSQEDDLPF